MHSPKRGQNLVEGWCESVQAASREPCVAEAALHSSYKADAWAGDMYPAVTRYAIRLFNQTMLLLVGCSIKTGCWLC